MNEIVVKSLRYLRNFTVHRRRFSDKPAKDILESICTSITSVVGSENISLSKAVRDQHGKDESYHSTLPPDVVVWPTCTNEVSKIAALCHQHKVPMVPFGTGTGLEGGVGALKGGICIDLSKMDKIVDFNPTDMDVTVQPGVTRNYLNTYLHDSGLWFPVDPGADASLCGMAATSASGTNAVRYGTMKHNVINLEVVLPDGKVIHTAGQGRRTRKTSAGYNLTNLFVGSEGTLGIITNATLKLHGIPETVVSAVCSFENIKSAVDAVVEVMGFGIPVAKIEILDEIAMDACNKYSGLSYKIAPTLFLEFHGGMEEVKVQASTTGDIVHSNGGSDFVWSREPEETKKLWKARHNLYYAILNLRPGAVGYNTDVCVPISNLPDVINRAKEEISKLSLLGKSFGWQRVDRHDLNYPFLYDRARISWGDIHVGIKTRQFAQVFLSSQFAAPLLGHVGDGNFHLTVLFDPNDAEEKRQAKELADKVSRHALALNGTCTGEHGIGCGKIDLLEEEIGYTGIGVMKEIKRTLDPHNIMNPGKIFHMN